MPRRDWTDVNESDPGITLLALFAWLALGLFLLRRFLPVRLGGGKRANRDNARSSEPGG